MSGTDRDLVAALRAELAAVDPSRPCDRRAEIAGLGPAVGAREPAVARLAVRLGGHPAAGHGPGSRRAVLLPVEAVEWGRAAEHCRLAWLRGRFLARGSLSLAGGRAHLEFVVPVTEAPVLAERLAAGARGTERGPLAPRRPQPRPQRGVGEPAAVRRGRGTAAGRDRGPGGGRAAGGPAADGPGGR